jgi:TonB-linked SusC/RagA family outer membrane protein
MKKWNFSALRMWCAMLFLIVAAQVSAQYTVNVQRKTIAQAIKIIEKKADYSFFYVETLSDLNKKVSFNANNESIESILNKLFAGTRISYQIQGKKQIVLSQRKSVAKEKSSESSEAAESFTVRGHVTGTNGEPLVGVTVMAADKEGTSTDIDGNYSLSLRRRSPLTFSYIGYVSQKVNADKSGNANVSLKEDNIFLNDVVVIGYGTQKRKDVTTAVSTVSTADLDQRPITSAAQAIEGRAAGVQVIQPSGMPGTSLSIRVRGATSVQASNEPLYVVDGITSDDISNLSANDIESIQVLKDASSAAIYGARASNGVVLITTKRGHSGKTTVKLDVYAGFSNLGKSIKALNTEQYKDLMADLAKYSNVAPSIPADEHRYTNWEDVLFKTGTDQNYQLSLSNGNDKLKYFISAGHAEEKGIVNKAYFKRTNVRANIDSEMFKWLSISMSAAYTNNRGRSVTENSSSMRSGSILSVINTPPFMQIWSTTNPGQYDEDAYGSRIMNPMAANAADETSQTDRLTGSLGLTFNIYKGLTFKTSYSADLNHSRNDYYLDPTSTLDGRSTKGSVSEGHARNFEWTWENTANYSGQFGLHGITLLGGAILQHAQYNADNLSGFDLPTNYPNIHSVSVANQINLDDTWAAAGAWALSSFIGRVNYNYNDRYLVTANIRTDGSSRFAPGHRWGTFPSISAGWRMSSESFMASTRNVLNDLKIRASWGLNGNQGGIGNYSYLAYMKAKKVTPTADNTFPGLAISANTGSNTELTWEKTHQWNVGIDASMFHSRLNMSLDLYYKKTKDLLLTVSLPDNVNLPGGITRNDGEMRNKGLEFSISSKNFTGPFKWNTDVNFSMNRNKVLKLGLNKIYYYAASYMTGEPAIILKEGLPLGSFFGYISEGVDPETGNIIYKDLNNNGHTDPGDRTIIGDAQPDFTYGITNDFSWKGLSLSIFFQGSQGNDIFNASRIETEGMVDFRNQSTEVLRRWERPGMETDIPRVGNNDNIHNSTRFVEDGSYLRLKSLTLAYDFTGNWMKKLSLSKVQIYCTAQNLFTITGYNGYDPEVNAYGDSAVELGVDYGTYPQSRTFIFGTNIEF